MSALLIKSLNLGIIDSALSWLIGALTTLFMWIVEFTIDLILLLLAEVLYELGLTLLTFVDFFQAFFNALCGMGRYWDSSGQKFVKQDPIISLITNEAVLQVFLALTVVAIIMLFMTTLIAMVRTEFNSEGAKNTKGNILGQALKSLFMFFMVPAACVFGIIFSSALLNMVYTATSGGESVTAGGMVWYSASYNANRLRNNSTLGLDTGLLGVTNVSEDFVFNLFSEWGYLDDFGGRNTEDVELVANAIDSAFKSGTTVITNDVLAGVAWLDQAEFSIADAMNDEADGWHTKETGIEYSYRNLIITEVFYSIRDMNFIVLFLGGGIALYIMFIAAFGLIIRLYKCAILFMLSAPISALTPLDGGQTFKSWRKLMIGSVCSAFAVVIAFNLVFLLIPIMSEINIFDPKNPFLTSWNRLVNMLFVLTGLYTIKETSKWVAGMLGIEDPLAAGSEIAGKVMGTVGKMGAMAGGAIAAGVGKAMAAKAGQKATADSQALSDKMDEKGKQVDAAAASVEQQALDSGLIVKGKDGKALMGEDGKPVFREGATAAEKAQYHQDVSSAKEEAASKFEADNSDELKMLRANAEGSNAIATKWGGRAAKADGVWQNTLQKTMGSKLQKFDDFMGGSKIFGGFDQEGNIEGLGGLAFRGLKTAGEIGVDRSARIFSKGAYDEDEVGKKTGAMQAEYDNYTAEGRGKKRKYYHREKVVDKNGDDVLDNDGNVTYRNREISSFEYEKGRKENNAAARRGVRTANIRAWQAGNSTGSQRLAAIQEAEATGKRMVEMTKQAADEVARLIKTLTDGLKRMGNDVYKNGVNTKDGLSQAAYQMYGQELARLSQLAGRGPDGRTLNVQEIAAGLISGDNTAHNLQENARKNASEMQKFYNNNINMGGIKVEMMGGNIKEALQEVFSGLNIEGASLEEQMGKITSEIKKEVEKQNAELKKQNDMIKKLAVAIAKYGKRLNPGK